MAKKIETDSIRDVLIEASHHRGGRRSEIDIWASSHPEEFARFVAYVAEFVDVRRDGSFISFIKLKRILEDRLSIRVSQNTLTGWVRRQYPDEPALKY